MQGETNRKYDGEDRGDMPPTSEPRYSASDLRRKYEILLQVKFYLDRQSHELNVQLEGLDKASRSLEHLK